MLYPVIKDYKYGFINIKGELIVEPTYLLVGRFAEDKCVVERFPETGNEIQSYVNSSGKKVVCSTKLQGYINSKGQEIIPPKHTLFCSSFSEGLAQYENIDGKMGFIDKSGVYKIAPQFKIDYDGEISIGFSEGIAAVATEKGWTYINKQGDKLFNKYFQIAKRFQDGYALVSLTTENIQTDKKLFFIDTNGQYLETIPCNIKPTCQGFRNQLCEVILPSEAESKKLNLISFINTDGDIAFEGKFSFSSGFHEGVCIVQNVKGKYGVINTEGEWVIEPLYENIGLFNCGLAPFRQNKKWGLLNAQGEVIITPRFSFINSFIGYLPPIDPFHNSELRELTTAMIFTSEKKNQSTQEVYINRTGEIISPFDISDI